MMQEATYVNPLKAIVAVAKREPFNPWDEHSVMLHGAAGAVVGGRLSVAAERCLADRIATIGVHATVAWLTDLAHEYGESIVLATATDVLRRYLAD